MSGDDFQPSEEAGLEPINPDVLGIIGAARFAMDVAKITESPIETLFGVALLRHLQKLFPDRVWWGHASTLGNAPPDAIQVVAQLQWRNFRIDWAVLVNDQPLIFIECDGREFHTGPEQEAKDRARDKVIRDAGIEIARFTGSELHNADAHCGSIVASFVATRVVAP